jgi:hypothetical protein
MARGNLPRPVSDSRSHWLGTIAVSIIGGATSCNYNQ